ncbi:hypothetical protein [Halegenticoccus tardaugens]|uniref:hypothetical protein n=1 Tax=Halegenticoccus tardaugens TaxID=2071624 RepID=UPI00100B934C|nr:hypothetical protein [Halegenticoccus tardaugens]
MSEFDDFIDDETTESKTHQPKKPKSNSATQEEPQKQSLPSNTEAQNTDRGLQSVQNQTEEIANSIPTSWDREQFAMFFKESEVFRYEDLMHDAEGHLKRGYNVRNDRRYEIDQAFIDLALERVTPEEVAARVVENRGYDP